MASWCQYRKADHERVRQSNFHECRPDLQCLSEKGQRCCWRDADIVVWDPEATKTISSKTDHQNVDYNIFEGMKIKGCPSHTISQGKIVYANGELDVERGAGRYVDRPPFAPYYDALQKQAQLAEPVPVKR